MKLLLDTCSLLWALHKPSRLSATARRSLEDRSHSLHVSVVTFWEISLKAGLGKLSFTRVNPEDYPALVLESGWSIHPLSAEVAASAGRLPRVPDHRDPFDRMLAWTAIQEGFSLVSGDAAFRDYAPHGLKVCW